MTDHLRLRVVFARTFGGTFLHVIGAFPETIWEENTDLRNKWLEQLVATWDLDASDYRVITVDFPPDAVIALFGNPSADPIVKGPA